MNVLHLTVKKKWFDMIASGEKPEEYREEKGYWIQRLMNYDIISRNSWHSSKKYIGFKHFDTVLFTNGYGKNSPKIELECLGITIGVGKNSWGAPKHNVFIIKLGKIVSHE